MVEKIILKDKNEWLKNRQRIGGSDASSILGMNPYKSNIELWAEKTGRKKADDISDKPYIKYGNDAEPLLRELFKLDFPQYKVEYEENNIFINDKYPFAHASLDGYLTDSNGRKGILEIKTTELLNSNSWKKWDNCVPNNYYIQVLHYLMVTDFDFVWIKGQLKSTKENIPYLQTKHYYIDRKDVEEEIEYLAEKEKEFWEMVEKDQEPSLILPEI